jgi:hypothetical protein
MCDWKTLIKKVYEILKIRHITLHNYGFLNYVTQYGEKSIPEVPIFGQFPHPNNYFFQFNTDFVLKNVLVMRQ